MGLGTTGPSQSSELKLEALYAKQHNLLERQRIHQRNLEKLTLQEAKHGITVPLPLMNDIELQQTRIAEIEKELALVDNQVNKVTRQAAHSEAQQRNPLTTVTIEGIDYLVDCLFPALGSLSVTLPDRTIKTEQYYVGGFELHTLLRQGVGLELIFYRHGRRVAPVIDKEQHKIIFPRGNPIAVPAVALNTLRKETFADITPERIAEGRWTVISPSTPQTAQIRIDWPQGYHGYIVTTKMPFDEGYELWMVQTIHDHPMNLPIVMWFYMRDWNVAPVIDKDKLALMFPEQT